MNRDNARIGAPSRKYRLTFSHPLAPHIFLWLGAVAAATASFTQIPGPYADIIQQTIENPIIFFLEFLALLITVYFCYYASGTVWIAVALTSFSSLAFSMVNKYKVFLRGDPFMPSDIFLGGEALNIASASSLKIGAGSIILAVLMLLGCVALGLFFRFRRARPLTRLVGSFAALSLAVVSFFCIYSNETIYTSIPVKGNIYNMVNEYNSKGFIFAFIYHTKDLNLGALRPDGYSADRAREILAGYGGQASGDGGDYTYATPGPSGSSIQNGWSGGVFAPDIIMLMSEAFWDITNIPTLIFDGEGGFGDPIPVFHELKADSITGEFYADVYGGGTDTTEYSVLTGHSIANFKNEVASAYKSLVRKPTDSIVRSLRGGGYTTIAMHPGYPWFYNRQNVYPWLGFESFIDISAFDEVADKSGNYISDFAMTEMLINMYKDFIGAEADAGTGVEAVAGAGAGAGGGIGGAGAGAGGPLFCFAVSIQNHGPYDAGYMYGAPLYNYLTSPEITLSIKGEYTISNYIKGLQDADASLGRLTDYLETVGRPVVLVFFGDHLPGLGSNFSAYKELGYPIGYDGGLNETSSIFKGCYLIWANEAARGLWPEYESLKATTHRLSASYLGVYMMECLGYDLNAYEKLVAKMHTELPVYHSKFFGTEEENGAALLSGNPDTEEAGMEEMGEADATAADAGAAGTGAADASAAKFQNEYINELLMEYRIAQYYKIFDEKIGEVN